MMTKTKRRVRAAVVAAALGSGLTMMGLFAVITISDCEVARPTTLQAPADANLPDAPKAALKG
ncbi:MAG: hypothetical protein R3C59_20455 [Planctomycetaceae bacterium]